MAHFAELNENNVVLRVTVVANEVLLDENNVEQESLGLNHLEHLGGRWVQTSYNNSFRKNYAGIGFTYDAVRDAFIPPKPFDSWSLNEDTCQWEAPIPMPTFDEEDPKYYTWDEDSTSWVEVEVAP
jgi:hypothetical protein